MPIGAVMNEIDGAAIDDIDDNFSRFQFNNDETPTSYRQPNSESNRMISESRGFVLAML
jgi:hypothetical protein